MPVPAGTSVASLLFLDAEQGWASTSSGYPARGTHELIWSGEGDSGGIVPPGIYLARLEVGGRTTATRRLVMIR